MENLTTACSKESPGVMNGKPDFPAGEDDSDLELGLGLSLGGGFKFLTAQDLPSLRGSQARPIAVQAAISGTKRSADRDPASSSPPPSQSQVVGWPPIRTIRMHNLANQTRAMNDENAKINGDSANKKMNNGNDGKANTPVVQENTLHGFVKVNMDGVQIGRKLDLNAHSSYESLALTIQDMFLNPFFKSACGEKDQLAKASKLLDGSSEFVLTYEDKEGDWMLVGDVPFRMFQGTVRRLRIMRTSEANGLAPRSQEENDRPRVKT